MKSKNEMKDLIFAGSRQMYPQNASPVSSKASEKYIFVRGDLSCPFRTPNKKIRST